METENKLNQGSIVQPSYPEHHYDTAPARKPATKAKPVRKPHCYEHQTDVYSSLIGVKLPYGSAANVVANADGSVTFASSSDSSVRVRVTVFADARVASETVCVPATTASCTSSVIESSTSLESAAILIKAIRPNSGVALDVQGEAYKTFRSELNAAKDKDAAVCVQSQGACP